MASSRLLVNDQQVVDALKRLAVAADDSITRKTLQRTSFEVLDALKAHVASIFDGPRTWFLAGSFRFKLRKSGRGIWTSELGPLRKSAAILARHLDRRRYGPDDANAITIYRRKTSKRRGGDRLRYGKLLAVPNKVNVKRTQQGRVRKADLPARILGEKGKGFVSRDGRTIVVRQHKSRKAGLRPLVYYFLHRYASNPPAFHFVAIAKRTAAPVRSSA